MLLNLTIKYFRNAFNKTNVIHKLGISHSDPMRTASLFLVPCFSPRVYSSVRAGDAALTDEKHPRPRLRWCTALPPKSLIINTHTHTHACTRAHTHTHPPIIREKMAQMTWSGGPVSTFVSMNHINTHNSSRVSIWTRGHRWIKSPTSSPANIMEEATENKILSFLRCLPNAQPRQLSKKQQALNTHIVKKKPKNTHIVFANKEAVQTEKFPWLGTRAAMALAVSNFLLTAGEMQSLSRENASYLNIYISIEEKCLQTVAMIFQTEMSSLLFCQRETERPHRGSYQRDLVTKCFRHHARYGADPF